MTACMHTDEGWEMFPCNLPKGHAGSHSMSLIATYGDPLTPEERKSVEEYRELVPEGHHCDGYPQFENRSIRELLTIIDRLAPKPEA